MHVDVDVELAGHLEDPVDLAVRITVRIGGGADNLAATLERIHHQFVRPRIVEHALLGEYADLDVDRPTIFVDQAQDAFEPTQADAGVDLELRAHVGGPVDDAFLERLGSALAHVLG